VTRSEARKAAQEIPWHSIKSEQVRFTDSFRLRIIFEPIKIQQFSQNKIETGQTDKPRHKRETKTGKEKRKEYKVSD